MRMKKFSNIGAGRRKMILYFASRFAFVPVTLFLIMLVNFAFVQFAPGGPIEVIISKYQNPEMNADGGARISGVNADVQTRSGGRVGGGNNANHGAVRADDELRQKLIKEYGFDQPFWTRFFDMMRKYLAFDFGNSFFQDRLVADLVLSKMPVSIGLGLLSMILIYSISIPLGIKKAIRHGSKFDNITSFLVIIGYAVPVFLIAILLVVFFASNRFLNWFPLRSLVSDNFAALSVGGKILDYLWHIALPVLALSISGFATLTILVKNYFREEMGKLYVQVAKAKGLSERAVLYRHIFRNAMLIIVAGFPAMFVSMLFTGSVLIEVIFSLDGMGLLGFNAVVNRDYPVIFGTLYIFSFIGLLLNIITDVMYLIIDPRINFEGES